MKKRNLAVMMLMCITLAGCGNLSNGKDADPESGQIQNTTPTPTEPFVYGKISPCLADVGNHGGNHEDGPGGFTMDKVLKLQGYIN